MTRPLIPQTVRTVLMLLALALIALTQAAWAQSFPKLTGRVVDEAALLGPQDVAALTAKLAALEQQTGRQVVVVTLKDLQGYDIADYGYRLGRAWGIGEKETDSGTLLIVAPNERRMRIEVGYGLEGVLTDALSSRIINETMVPRFKANDYPGGIAAGTDTIIQILTLPPDQQRKVVAAAEAPRKSGGFDFGTVLFLLFIFIFVVLPILRSGRKRGRRRRRSPWGDAPIVIWGPGDWHDDDRGGGGFGGFGGGGGFGGFGGFSGGGGGFGGGGASGGW